MNFYVYGIQEVRGSQKAPIKIGVATSVARRLEALQIGNPRELKIVVRFGPMTKHAAYELEAFFHRRFRPQRLRGEWFSGKILKWLLDSKGSNARLHSLDRKVI